MNPYLLTSIFFLFLAGLAALDSALTSFQILPWLSGLQWVRVHLITLGALSEALFGLLPVLAAKRAGVPKPAVRLDIWMALTGGLVILMLGIPQVNYVLVVSGGTLIFMAALMVFLDVRQLAPPASPAGLPAPSGRVFYLAGLAYLLLGIIVGSGLWFGWGEALRIATPIEVHIHSNTWGFMSLVFAGLVVDLYPRWTGSELAWKGSIRYIFGLMTLGALGSILGPWLGVGWITALGILLHQAATVWLLLNMIKPLPGTAARRKPGIWHIITSYAWQLAIVLAAPLIFLLRPGFSPVGVEQTAPQVLIYGWMLQYAYGLLPYLLRQAKAPQEEAELGGSWVSLAVAHAGGVFLGASLMVPALSGVLLGIAYLLWFISLLPVARQLWEILSSTGGG